MWLGADLGVKKIGTFGEGKDEAAMMADFADFMGKWRPQVVTWNGRGFDLPVLALRALRFGLDFRWYYRGEGYRYRFTEEGHLDLCDVISDHGAAKMTSLDGAARTIGLPGKRTASTAARSRGCSTPGRSMPCAATACRTSRRPRSCSCATGWCRAISTATATGTPPAGCSRRWRPTGDSARLLDGVDRRRLLLE